MPLSPGSRLGPYEVLSAIGQGGMGEVWRARDTKLGRDVALKILPEQFATDPDRLARFKREAQVLASLNHPNIGGIHGLEETDGVQALVLELVEGPTLADRIAQGPISLDEALPIANQIAEALETAHEHGIIHRDLKPSNIKLRPDGTVKVLDFGLAKAIEPMSAGRVNATASLTITSPALTRAGIILGTAAYMAPEQATGKTTDERSDIWAFGVILYEMLTGRPGFTGETTVEVLSEVLKADPDWTALPPGTPPTIRSLLRRCLQKDRRRRLHDIADARIEIEEAATAGEMTIQAPPAPRRRERVLWLLALAATTVAASAALVLALRPGPAPPEMRLELTTAPTPDPASLAVSPDGRNVVFVAPSKGRSSLWLRSLETGTARPLTGTDTDSGTVPFWSPDSRSVAFFGGGRLRRIDIDGGAIQTLAAVGGSPTGAWNKEGIILFSMLGQPFYRIAAEGGQPVALPKLVREGGAFLPHFLPDGRHFLYYLRGRPEVRGVYVGNIEDGASGPRLLDADTAAVYVSGHVLFGRQTALFAQRFDLDTLTLDGAAPFAIAENVTFPSLRSGLSASDNGTIVFRGGLPFQRLVTWFDRQGRRIGTAGDAGIYLSPVLAPDGIRVALHRVVEGNVDVWLLDTGRNVFTRFTTDPGDDAMPIWSPDGTRVVFSSNRSGRPGSTDLYVKSATGAGQEQLLFAGDRFTGGSLRPSDWSPDGRLILFRTSGRNSGVWALPLEGDRRPFPVVEGPFDAADAQFSPDGKWIALQSNESGRFEISIQPFPTGGRLPVSTAGGAQPRWRRDGKELFYIAPDGRLLAVSVQLAPNVEAVKIGVPAPLFETPLAFVEERQQYVVSPDGQQFLMTASVEREEVGSPITVILNWKAKP